MNKPTFWNHLESLISGNRVVIETPRGSEDPSSPGATYPVDYGYLEGTFSMDGSGIDVFVGSNEKRNIDAILCTVDLEKRDSEVKILIGCTEDEKRAIVGFYELFSSIKALLVRRS